MRKYWQLIKTSWDNSSVYRLNFVMWRVRVVLGLLTGYFLWIAVYANQKIIFGYTETQMLTYILVASLIQSLVLSTRSIDLAGIINNGDLSNILIKPWSNLKYWFSQDLADKALNMIFSIGEIIILLLLLRPAISLSSGASMLLAIPVLIVATLLYYFINYLMGMMGFWTPQIWAPRFVLMTLLSFIAGNTFPLDILPDKLRNFINLTPFPYLVYLPTKILLGKVTAIDALHGMTIAGIWTMFFYLLVKYVWKKGLRVYGAEGK